MRRLPLLLAIVTVIAMLIQAAPALAAPAHAEHSAAPGHTPAPMKKGAKLAHKPRAPKARGTTNGKKKPIAHAPHAAPARKHGSVARRGHHGHHRPKR